MTAPPLRTAARPDTRMGRLARLGGVPLWVGQHAPLLALSVSVLLWASAFVGIRAAAQSLAPGPLSLGRLVVALFALLVVMLSRREPLPTRRALLDAGPALLVCGVVWFGVYNLALNAAERHVDAGTAAMIVYISPVLIALLAGSVLGEGYSRPLFAGCAVSFVGVSVIGAASASHRATTQGVALCLIAAVSLASGAVSQKIVLRHLSGLQTIFLCCAIGVAMLLPFAGALVQEMQTASMSALVWTAYLGVFPTAIGFLTWAFALSRSEAGPLGITTYLVPAVSVILAWLVLAEAPRPIALLGGVLCLAGVAISRESRVRRPRAEEAHSAKTSADGQMQSMNAAMMQAIVVDRFGPPGELRPRRVPVPEVGPSDALVEVFAAGVNPVDAGNRRDGSWAGLELPFVPGSDASGVVVAVGEEVQEISVGDEVFYFSDFLGSRGGSYAEYQAIDARHVAHKPDALPHAEAAAIPLAGGTAYELVVRRLAVEPGERLLVVGAAGGVGAFAVQLGALRGAEVIAVSRREHHEYLRSLGATTTIDYTDRDPFAKAGEVDAVVDLVGGDTIGEALKILVPFGRAASAATLRGDLDLAVDKNITLHGVLVRPDGTRLRALRDLVDRGALHVHLRTVLPITSAAEAHRLIESGHGRGKVVLLVRGETLLAT